MKEDQEPSKTEFPDGNILFSESNNTEKARGS